MSANPNTTCWQEDGSKSLNIPCGFTDIGSCCGDGWDYLGNGLCRQSGTTSYAQADCTDPTFEGCLSFCDKSVFEGYGEVSRCGPNSWCCAGAAGIEDAGSNCCTLSGVMGPSSLSPFPFYTIAASMVGFTTVSPLPSSASSTSRVATSSSLSKALTTSRVSVSSSPSKASTGVKQTAKAATTAKSAFLEHASTSIPSPRTSSRDSSSGPSTGAKIAIGVAIPVIALLLAALLFFVFRYRKQKKYLSGLQGKDNVDTNIEIDGSDAPTTQLGDQGYVHELDADSRQEMSTMEGMRHELPERNRQSPS